MADGATFPQGVPSTSDHGTAPGQGGPAWAPERLGGLSLPGVGGESWGPP